MNNNPETLPSVEDVDALHKLLDDLNRQAVLGGAVGAVVAVGGRGVSFTSQEVLTWRSIILPALRQLLSQDAAIDNVCWDGRFARRQNVRRLAKSPECRDHQLRGFMLYRESKLATLFDHKTSGAPAEPVAPTPVIHTCTQCQGFDQRGVVAGLCCYCASRAASGEMLRPVAAPPSPPAGHDYGEQWSSPSDES